MMACLLSKTRWDEGDSRLLLVICRIDGLNLQPLKYKTMYFLMLSRLCQLLDSKGYHGVHAHMIGTRETAAQQWCVLTIEKQHVEGSERLLTATGGGVLATATGSHVTSPGRRATAVR
jgi:hypothetical protein